MYIIIIIPVYHHYYYDYYHYHLYFGFPILNYSKATKAPGRRPARPRAAPRRRPRRRRPATATTTTTNDNNDNNNNNTCPPPVGAQTSKYTIIARHGSLSELGFCSKLVQVAVTCLSYGKHLLTPLMFSLRNLMPGAGHWFCY